jgi:glycosyltransferase involved in cell wall biosynthesis
VRLALFSDRFPELSETFVSGEVRELRRQGVDVTVYARAPKHRDPRWDGAAPVLPLEVGLERRVRRLAPVARLAAARPLGVAADVRARRRWRRAEGPTPLRRLAPTVAALRRDRVEHIHVHFAAEAALDALRIARLTRIPFSVTAHAYEIFQRPANLAEKVARAAFVTVPCAYNVEQLDAAGVPTANVHVRMLGANTEAFRRREPYRQDGPVLAVGRLVEKKGFETLVEAAALADLGEVLIVGDGPLREPLAARIAQLGLDGRVTLAGTRSPAEIRAQMERASLLVVPSVVAGDGDRDALPVVIWEALAMELPVVGTTVAGLPEVIRAPWGSTVAPRSPRALADAVARWRAMPADARATAGRHGRRWLHDHHRQELATRRLVDLVADTTPGARAA